MTTKKPQPKDKKTPQPWRHSSATEVLLHCIDYRYGSIYAECSEDLTTALDNHAEEVARECIIEGYHSGELNCYWYDHDKDKEYEIRGWWEIRSA